MNILPDTGDRTQYDTGAVREVGDKPRVDGVSPFAMLRLGELFTRGGRKYGDFRNWEQGMPWSACIGGILRHTYKYMMRDESEDHLAAIMWNAQALIHYEETGLTELDDRPLWSQPTRGDRRGWEVEDEDDEPRPERVMK